MSKFSDQVADLMQGGDRLVTQYMHDWDGTMTEAAIIRVANQEILDNSQTGVNTRHNGTGRIRPSNLGQKCARLHTLSWLGYPQVIGDRSLMDDGSQRHYYWQKVGLSAGFLTDIEVKVAIPYLGVKGSMDGRMVDGSVFEFKETGPRIYDKVMATRQPTHNHLLQVHAYMKALDTKKASLVYEKRSYQVEWHEFRVEWDQAIYEALVDRIAPVVDATVIGELPPMLEECLSLSGHTFTHCRFHDVCPSAEYQHQS